MYINLHGVITQIYHNLYSGYLYNHFHAARYIGNAVFFLPSQQPPVGQGLLSVEDSWSRSEHTTLGRTPLYEWSARRRDLYLTTHNTHKTDIQAPGGIRTHNPSKRAVADPRLRQRAVTEGNAGILPNIFFPITFFLTLHSSWASRSFLRYLRN